MSDLLVLGAGMAGLGASIEARGQGVDSLTLERADAPGGLCRSTTVADCDFDYGPKVIVPGDRTGEQVLDFLGDNYAAYQLVEEAYHSEFGFVGFPLQRNLVDLPAGDRRRIAADIAAERARPREITSYRDWLLSQYGTWLCEQVLFPYEEKKWRVPLTTLDHRWARNRPVNVDPEEVARGAERRPTDHRRYYYPKRGNIATLTEAMAAAAGPIALNTEVLEVHPAERVVRTSSGDHHYRRLVSTLPLDELLRRIRLPGDAVPATDALNWLDIQVFNLVFQGELDLPGTAVHFPEPRFPFRRVTVLGNLCPALARPGLTPISVEVSIPPGGVASSDADQVAAVLAGLRQVPRFASATELAAYQVLTIEHAYPRQDRDTVERVREAHDWCAGLEIHNCGRGGNFEYCNSDVAFEQGRRAVRRLLARGSGATCTKR
jgi:UDP-galactopyranose mutase